MQLVNFNIADKAVWIEHEIAPELLRDLGCVAGRAIDTYLKSRKLSFIIIDYRPPSRIHSVVQTGDTYTHDLYSKTVKRILNTDAAVVLPPRCLALRFGPRTWTVITQAIRELVDTMIDPDTLNSQYTEILLKIIQSLLPEAATWVVQLQATSIGITYHIKTCVVDCSNITPLYINKDS